MSYKNQYVVEDLERFLMKQKLEQLAKERPGYRRQDMLLAERQAAKSTLQQPRGRIQTPASYIGSDMLPSEDFDEMPEELIVETFDPPPAEEAHEAKIEEPEILRTTSSEKEDPMFNTFFKNQKTPRANIVAEEPVLQKKKTIVASGNFVNNEGGPEEPKQKRDLQMITHQPPY